LFIYIHIDTSENSCYTYLYFKEGSNLFINNQGDIYREGRGGFMDGGH